MKNSDEFVEYILELLEGIGEIQVKRMFSGTLLTVRGKQLGIIIDDVLYFKITDLNLQYQYAREGSVQFSYSKKNHLTPVIIKNWWSVPERYLDDKDALTELAEVALDCG